jgi:hypothetical protein
VSWCFRVRVNLRDTSKLGCANNEWVIANGDQRIWLAAADGPEPKLLADARVLALRGAGYANEAVARTAGELWQARLMFAFACLKIGADFGGRSPGGAVTDHGLAVLSIEHGGRVLNDLHGVMAFECDPTPRFVRMGPVTATLSSPHDRLVAAMKIAATVPGFDPAAREAYDLFSASFGVPSADARLALLMIAFEILLDLQPRAEPVRAHVEKLIADTRSSALPVADIASIAGALEWLRSESIRHGGRRLATALEPKRYGDMAPAKFFQHCYDLRSRLMHGAHPLPARAEIDLAAANMEVMLSDLLCRRGTQEASRR